MGINLADIVTSEPRTLEDFSGKVLAIGDLATARTKAMQTSRLTGEMVDQSKRLLDLLGIPWIQAPAEGEAQASAMARIGVAYAAASQDFDSLLFGSPRLVKNLAITGRRKLPRKEGYVDVQPEEISLEATLANLGITREQLVDIGLLIGTDFNEGVKGIGPKKALRSSRNTGPSSRPSRNSTSTLNRRTRCGKSS